MQKNEVERYAFLYLCGAEDRDRLTGRREMTFSDFERLIYLAECLELREFELEVWEKYERLFAEKEEKQECLECGTKAAWKPGGDEPSVEEAMERRRLWIEEFCRNSGCEEICGLFTPYLPPEDVRK